MSTSRGANNSRHRVFKGRPKRSNRSKINLLYQGHLLHLRVILFRRRYVCKKEKITLLRAPAGRPSFAWVASQYPRPGLGILTQFPFDRRGSPKTAHFETDFSYLLGSTNSRPIAVHVKPFSTSVFKVLIWIFATATKICTKGRFTPAYAASCTITFAPSYSLRRTICHSGRV